MKPLNLNYFYLSALLLSASLLLNGCSHESLTPDKKDVKVSKEDPPKDCKEVGRVQGSTSSRKGTYDEALQDMIREASEKSANYLRVDAYSSYGGSVTGTAFRCP